MTEQEALERARAVLLHGPWTDGALVASVARAIRRAALEEQLRWYTSTAWEVHGEANTRAALEALTRLVAQAVERCCCAVCKYCHDKPPILDEDGDWIHAGAIYCDAADIRSAIRARGKEWV